MKISEVKNIINNHSILKNKKNERTDNNKNETDEALWYA
jgi:hypothetical protein